MYKKTFSRKIWFKIFSLLLAGLFFLQSTPAYARKYTEDESMKKFFKSDLEAGLIYVGTTVASVAIPVIGAKLAVASAASSAATAATEAAAYGAWSGMAGTAGMAAYQGTITAASTAAASAAASAAATSMVIGGVVNVGSQIAVAAGADPKLTSIIGGVAGGIASGGMALYNSPQVSLASTQGLWTMAANVAPWTASAAASVYVSEQNPAWGSLAGMGAGIAASSVTQYAAARISDAYFTANGQPLTKDQAADLNYRDNHIQNQRLPESAQQSTSIQATGQNYPEASGFHTEGFKAGTIDPVTKASPHLSFSEPIAETATTTSSVSLPGATVDYTAVMRADNTIYKTGDVWRSATGTPIADYGMLRGVAESFRTISPGQWAGLLVAAGVTDALDKNSAKDPNVYAWANAAGSFAGGLTGGLVNQWNGLGKAWSGTDAAKSPWHNKDYSFFKSAVTEVLDTGIDYGLGLGAEELEKLSPGLTPQTNSYISGGAKLLAGGILSGTMNKVFLTKESTRQRAENMTIGHRVSPKLDVQASLSYVDPAKAEQIFREAAGDEAKLETLIQERSHIAPEELPHVTEAVPMKLAKEISLPRSIYTAVSDGVKEAIENTIPKPAPSVGLNAGYSAEMYRQGMLSRFASTQPGQDFVMVMANSISRSMGSTGANQLKESAVDSTFNRNSVYWGSDLDTETKKYISSMPISEAKVREMYSLKPGQMFSESSALARALDQGSLKFTDGNAYLNLEGKQARKIRIAKNDPAITDLQEPLKIMLEDYKGQPIAAITGDRRNPFTAQENYIGVIAGKQGEICAYLKPLEENRYEVELKANGAQSPHLLSDREQLTKAFRDTLDITDKDIQIIEQKDKNRLFVTLATPEARQRFKQKFENALTKLAERDPTLDRKRVVVALAQEDLYKDRVEKDDANKLFVIQDNPVYLKNITMYDNRARPVLGITYSHDSDDLFNMGSRGFAERHEKKGTPYPVSATGKSNSVEEMVLDNGQFVNRVARGFMDEANTLIDTPAKIARATAYYYGAGGEQSLAETTQIYQPEKEDKDAVTYGKERMYYGYERGRRSAYVKELKVEGDVTKHAWTLYIPGEEQKGSVRRQLAQKAGIEYDLKADLGKKEAAFNRMQQVLLDAGIFKAGEENEKLADFYTSSSKDAKDDSARSAARDATYNQMINFAEEALYKKQIAEARGYNVTEKGIFVQDAKAGKQAMLPEYSSKVFYNKDETEIGRGTDIYYYTGLTNQNGNLARGGVQVKSERGPINLEGQGFMFKGQKVQYSPDTEIVNVAGRQVLENTGRYSVLGASSVEIQPARSDWQAFQNAQPFEHIQRNVLVQPMEENGNGKPRDAVSKTMQDRSDLTAHRP